MGIGNLREAEGKGEHVKKPVAKKTAAKRTTAKKTVTTKKTAAKKKVDALELFVQAYAKF